MPKPEVEYTIAITKLAHEIFGGDVMVAIDGMSVTMSALQKGYQFDPVSVHDFHSRLHKQHPSYSLVVLP